MRCNVGVDDFSLPGYDVGELIGFGGSGEVWRARETATGEVVALKRLRGAVPTSIDGDPLRREAALLSSVQHEHVVALRSIVPTDDGLVLVLEYASGGTPSDRFDSAYERHECGGISEREFYASLRKTLGVELTDAQLAAGWCSIFAGEIPETVALLRRLEGRVPLYAFSNTNPEHQRAWSRQFEEALRPFRKVFTSCELGVRKPGRAAFEKVSREIGVPLERILFFDDTLENVDGARRAGLQAVHVKSPQDVEDAVRRFVTPL